MRSKITILLLLLLGGALHLQAREVININRNWKFFSDNEGSSDNAPLVNLPHIWNNDALAGKKDYFRGIGNYVKEIDIPSAWQGKRVFLKCYGANTVSSLLVNGKLVGEHRGGYTSFAFDITEYIQYGRLNFVWLIVNNSPQMDILPIAGDQNSYGGVFRDVELIVTQNEVISLTDYASQGVYIAQKSVTHARVEAEATVKINGTHDNNVTATLDVIDSKDEVVASGTVKARLSGRATSTVKIPFSIDKPRLWNGTIDPAMYSVVVKIMVGDLVTDSLVVNTGFRYFSVDPQGAFVLNGKPYKIKGVVAHQDRAMVGCAITQFQVEEDFNLIRDMGANAVRVAGVVHNPLFYDLCDQHGIVVWSDFPLIGAAYLTDKPYLESTSFKSNATFQATEIIRQQYNHPSVVMWGLFSELRYRGDNPSDYVSELNMHTKREDPSRLTVAASNEDGEINFISDLIVWNHFFGWREGYPSDIKEWQKQLHTGWKNLRSGVSYAAGGSIFHQDDSLYRAPMQGNWHPERWQTFFHEEYFKYLSPDNHLWGIFVGNMFDYGAAGRTWGEGNGVNDCGLVTFDRKYLKDAYYFYKANWNNEDPFVYIGERRWDRRSKKRQDIRIYTNRTAAELFINGESKGVKGAENGTIVWQRQELQIGSNTIEVQYENLYDRVQISILPPGVYMRSE